MPEKEKQEIRCEKIKSFFNGKVIIDDGRFNSTCGISCETGCLASYISSLYGAKQEKRA